MRPVQRLVAAVSTLLVLVALVSVSGPSRSVEPGADPFYTYSGSAPLSSYAPGTVLATRTLPVSLAGIPTPLTMVQILYRSTDQLGTPVANVTSVIPSTTGLPGAGKAVAYQSFYDSLNPADSPSRAFAGGRSSGGAVADAESPFFAPFVAQGYAVIVTDTEGQNADFAAGPEYGRLTLDAIRAASSAAGTGLTGSSSVGLMGYSGGAIATGWAAALAPSYAPDVNQRLVGATEGGVLVDPAHNLHYIDGTPIWGGVEGMALVGVARAFHIDFSAYLSDFGRHEFTKLQNASIGQVLGQYPDFRFARLVQPQYADPDSIRPYVDAANAINLGSAPTPTVPMQIRQGAGGEAEGTPGNQPGIGPGDGVMIAGDVRALARQYCDRGATVDYAEYAPLSHVAGASAWLPEAQAFLNSRFAGIPATGNCAAIGTGNSLAPEVYTKPTPSKTHTRVRLVTRSHRSAGRQLSLAFAVVSRHPSGGATVGRVVIRVDGHRWRTVRVSVRAMKHHRFHGRHLRLPKRLSRGHHRIRLHFKPADTDAYTASRSRTIAFATADPR